MDKKNIIIAILLIILIPLSVYFFKTQTSNSKPDQVSNLNPPSPISQSNTDPNNYKPDLDNPNHSYDWLTYQDLDRQFSILYPPYLSPNQLPDGTVTFELWGPTQAENTEFYDGISVNIQSLYANNYNLKLIAEAEKNMLIDIYGETVSDIQTISVDSQTSYTFNDHMAQYIFIPQSTDKYLFIVNLSADPGQLDYQQIAQDMINSIQILN